MSDRTRKKKNGERKDKKHKRMRASVEARHAQAAPPKRSTDQPNVQLFKPGSACVRCQVWSDAEPGLKSWTSA